MPEAIVMYMLSQPCMYVCGWVRHLKIPPGSGNVQGGMRTRGIGPRLGGRRKQEDPWRALALARARTRIQDLSYIMHRNARRRTLSSLSLSIKQLVAFLPLCSIYPSGFLHFLSLSLSSPNLSLARSRAHVAPLYRSPSLSSRCRAGILHILVYVSH